MEIDNQQQPIEKTHFDVNHMIPWANRLIITAALLFLAAPVYSFWRGGPETLGGILVYYLAPFGAVGTLLLLLRRTPHTRVNVAIAIATTLATVYLAEFVFYLEFRPDYRVQLGEAEKVANAHSMPFDPRSRLDVVNDLRSSGRSAFPMMGPTSRIGGRDLRPLGGVANILTVLCNESGQYISYDSDERGFNNPKEIWALPEITTAVIGDSYAHGVCVREDSTLGTWIREKRAATLNLGIAGNGPLAELATIREYLPTLRPQIVLWFYYDNDLQDLQRERSEEILLRYLDPRFRQELGHRQDAVDRQLLRVVDSVMKIESSATRRGWRTVVSILMVDHLRQRLRIPPLDPVAPCCDLDLFSRIMSEAKETVTSWGGHLFVILLPAHERFGGPPWFDPAALAAKPSVQAIVDSLDIASVDVATLFQSHTADPRSMFIHPYSHYTGEAYRLIAEAVHQMLPHQ